MSTLETSPKLFAIKMIKIGDLHNQEIEHMENELMIVQQLKHKNIVKLCDLKRSSKNFYIIFKYYDAGNLQEYLINNKFKEPQIRAITKQLVEALNALYQIPATHRNLKLSKVLLHHNTGGEDNTFKVRLGGFKYSQLEDESPYKGNYENAAPEVFHNKPYARCSDIWSFGSMVYEMFTGNKLCGRINRSVTEGEIVEYKFIIKSMPSMEAMKFILRSTDWDVNKRITWEEVITDPFFTNTNTTAFDVNKLPKEYRVRTTRKYVIVTHKKNFKFNIIPSLQLGTTIDEENTTQYIPTINIEEAKEECEIKEGIEDESLIAKEMADDDSECNINNPFLITDEDKGREANIEVSTIDKTKVDDSEFEIIYINSYLDQVHTSKDEVMKVAKGDFGISIDQELNINDYYFR